MLNFLTSKPDLELTVGDTPHKEFLWLFNKSQRAFSGILKGYRGDLFFVSGTISNGVINIFSHQMCDANFLPSAEVMHYQFNDISKEFLNKKTFSISGNVRGVKDKQGKDHQWEPVVCTIKKTV